METISYQKDVKANKEHKCNLCGQRISKGEHYANSTHKQCGTVYDWKTHKHCSDIADRLNMYEDCDEGLSKEGFAENISIKYIDLMVSIFEKEDLSKYSIAIEQFRNVRFSYQLNYVIRHYAKIDSGKK